MTMRRDPEKGPHRVVIDLYDLTESISQGEAA